MMKLSPSLIAFHNISQENERRCSQTISRQKVYLFWER